MKIKYLALGALMAVISSIFQCIPAFFSEIFIILTIFSSIPIYIITRKHSTLGFLSYIVTFILITFISPHENLIFLFTNGLLGFMLGFFNNYLDNKYLICTISGIILLLSINVVTFIIGINLIGFTYSFNLLSQCLILVFSFIYCFVLNFICSLIYKRVESSIN